MVIAYHLISTAYGWWLPNDPRGSMSQSIRSDVVAELGALHYGRKRIQPNSGTIRDFYRDATTSLKHELLEFSAPDRAVLAKSFASTIREQCYTCYACAIMDDHVHLSIRKHRHSAEQMILTFQEYSRRALIEAGLRDSDHPVWGGPGWKVFLDAPEDVRRTIRYVQNNPVKRGWGEQEFEFLSIYDDWPFRKGTTRNRKR